MPSQFPSILSLHPTADCMKECPFCYIKFRKINKKAEKSIYFFESIINSLPVLGIKEIAMSVNYIDKKNISDKNLVFLKVLSKLARVKKIKFSITTNYENIINFEGKIFKYCDLVSLSFDEYKVDINNNIKSFLKAIIKLKNYVKVVNINLLLTKQVLKIGVDLIKNMSPNVDSIYLIVPKLVQLDFTKEELIEFLSKIKNYFISFETFSKINIDNCIKPFIYPFSELVPYCERGRSLIFINSWGEVSYCAFDVPFTKVDSDIEFINVVKNRYRKDLQEPVRICPFINFV